MDRREFLKSALTVAALGTVARMVGAEAGAAAANPAAGGGTPQVTRRAYRNTAATIPLLGFGMMRMPRLSPDRPAIDYGAAEKMIAAALDAGVNYFDTAYMYHDGLSEKCVGDLLSKYPRDRYYLADKMPVWMARDAAGVERIFREQLARCRTEYFDFYLLHALDAANWKLTEQYRALAFLDRMKAEGRIRRLGFSFHDTPEMLAEIVAARAWDFAQIQLNYLDWELYRSREQYEILTRAGIPVIVMEPLRGGALASLSPEATAVLRKADPAAGNAAWALRYAAGLPNVLCVLSGMSLPEHLTDNLRTFSPLKPLTDPERAVLAEALAVYRKQMAVPCTACRYCMPCPVGVEIPRVFGMYNQYRITGNRWLFQSTYRTIPEDARASACVACGRCARHCPQKIDIPGTLRKIAREVES